MHNSIPLLIKQDYAEEEADDGVVRQVLRAGRRRPVLALTVFVLVLVLSVASLFVLRPKFTATTLIVVNASQNLLNSDTGRTDTLADTTRVDTEAEVLRSDLVSLEAIRSLNLAGDPEFQPGMFRRFLFDTHLAPRPNSDAADVVALDRFRKRVSVQRRALTAVVAINATVYDADKAAAIADAVADAYLHHQVLAKVAALKAGRDAIDAQLTAASTEVARSKQALVAFAAAHPPAAPAAASGVDAPAPPQQLDDAGRLQADAIAAENSRIAAEAHDLAQRADLAQAQYDALLRSVGNVDTQVALQLPDSRIVSNAVVPAVPSFPQPIVFLVLGLAGGLILALAAAYAAERMGGGFADESQLAAAIKTQVAGAIPAVAHRRSRIDPYEPRFTDAIQRTAGVLEVALARGSMARPNQPPVVVVCASEAGEGVSTVAAGLARCFAAQGKRTLLLTEGDAIAASGSGLVVSGAPWHDGGQSADDAMGRLREAAKPFEIVIRDALPIGTSADALTVSRAADLVVFVVESRRTDRRTVRAGLAALVAAKAPDAEIVAVLNKQRKADRLYKTLSRQSVRA